MTQQTAIDYLVNLYYNEFNILLPSEYYEQAKQMEKEQIKSAWMDASDLCVSDEDAEQYYNETYGTRLQNETN